MIDATDRSIVVATQQGLPLTTRPYHAVAQRLGLEAAEVQERLARMLEAGIVRRIGVVPDHYALGYRGNGMAVWDVADERIGELGRRVGGLDFVSHCYHRPRHLPEWPYNLFAMVHGRDRDAVRRRVAEITALLGQAAGAHHILFSTRILKKTGLRLAD